MTKFAVLDLILEAAHHMAVSGVIGPTVPAVDVHLSNTKITSSFRLSRQSLRRRHWLIPAMVFGQALSLRSLSHKDVRFWGILMS